MGVVLTVFFLVAPTFSADRFELTNTRETPLPGKAVDLAVSGDGSWTFILTGGGEVAVYDRSGTRVQTLNIGTGYEQLEYDEGGKRLVLAGSSQKLKFVSLTMRFDIATGASPYRGPQGAPVIITVYSDFQCPYCARLVPLLGQVLEKYPEKAALQFKNFPLRNHRMAKPAAMAAMAAGNQGLFWEYHNRLFENYRDLSDELLVRIASELGLDMQRFEEDRKSVETSNIINRDIREASRIGVRGTPTVFLNGKQQGERSLEALSAAVEKELDTPPQP